MNLKKRIFWFLNHATLMDFEVNLLLDLGFEVFIPKILSKEAPRSSCVEFEYDKSLTIPKIILDKLNNYNFYQDELDYEIVDILNSYFDFVFIANIYPQVFNIAKSYKNTIIIRAFGYEKSVDYELVASQYGDRVHGFKKYIKPFKLTYFNEILRQLYSIRKRLFLGVAYKSIIGNEKRFFKERSIYLPVGLGQKIEQQKDTWIGDINRIMFVCPNIESYYYKDIYKNFANNFSAYDYVIAGKQQRNYPEDKRIVDYLDDETYLELFKTSSVMFYHSQEKRHLHYHPLEAINYGMPLVYMAGGLLEYFGGPNQPGMARTIDEAKEKIDRIFAKDIDFINEIKEKQVKILDEFKYDYVRKIWEKNFMGLANEK